MFASIAKYYPLHWPTGFMLSSVSSTENTYKVIKGVINKPMKKVRETNEQNKIKI